MDQRRWTERGFEVEGPLRVVVEDDLALVLVGEHFLDDLLRERFAGEVLTDERTAGMSLELGHVRLTLARLDGERGPEPAAEVENGSATTELPNGPECVAQEATLSGERT